jgi:hypothetical protein
MEEREERYFWRTVSRQFAATCKSYFSYLSVPPGILDIDDMTMTMSEVDVIEDG